MKKKIVLILLAVMVSALLVLPTVAAQTATVTVTPDSASASEGDTVIFTVKITDCTAAKSIGIIPTYDKEIFEMVSGSWLLSGSAMSDFDGTTASIAYADARGFNQNVFKFTLRVKSDVDLDTYSVSATMSVKNGNETVRCNVTEGKLAVVCDHNYSDYTSIGEESHQRICSKCQEKERKDHSFTDACDPSCNDCGYTRTVTHDYKTTWTADKTGHWHACSRCGDKKDFTSHTPGVAATEDNPQKCMVCQYTIAPALGHTHTFGTKLQSDATGHWKTCTDCGDPSEVEKHIYDNSSDTECNTCKYVRTLVHNYPETYESDENGHWQICNDCKEPSEKYPHKYDDDCDESCDECGYVRTAPHNYGEGVITSKPTKEAVGKKEYTCASCGHTKITELEYFSENLSGTDKGSKLPPIFILYLAIALVAGAAIGALITSVIYRSRIVYEYDED